MYFIQSGIPYVRFFGLFCLGIVVGVETKLEFNTWWFVSIVAAYAGSFLIPLNQLWIVRMIRSCLVYLLILVFGSLLVTIQQANSNTAHFIHRLDSITAYTAELLTIPEQTAKSTKVLLDVRTIQLSGTKWQTGSGKLIGYIEKSSIAAFQKGDILYVEGAPQRIRNNGNPYEFDYASYLERKNVLASHFIKGNEIVKLGEDPPIFVIRWADACRSFCEELIREKIHGENEIQFTTALLLGGTAGLDESLNNAYIATGTVHALAVSGLHVSLVYALVVLLFGRLKRRKGGGVIFIFISIFIFWFYALITGFTPSVVRAVSMFSLVIIAGGLKRSTSIYNTLAFSAFTILCFEPMWLYEIGFQFSFLAVVGIVFLHPILSNFIEVENKVLAQIWSMVCMTLAAQIAVGPLSCFYFHSFPLLFLPFNCIIIPLSSLALYTGLAGLLVFKLDVLATVLLKITEYLVLGMNYIVMLSSHISWSRVDFIQLSKAELCFMYAGILFVFIGIKYKKVGYLLTGYACILMFGGITFYLKNSLNKGPLITIYNSSNTIISFMEDDKAIVFSDTLLTVSNKAFSFAAYNHLAHQRINKLSFACAQHPYGLAIKETWFGQWIVWKGKVVARVTTNIEQDDFYALQNMADILVVSGRGAIKNMDTINKGNAIVVLDGTIKTKRRVEGKSSFYSCKREGAFQYNFQPND